MGNVGALKHPPLRFCEPQAAAIFSWCAHFGQDAHQNRISAESHGTLELADVALVFEHGLRYSVFLCQTVWFGEERAGGWQWWEL